ARLFCATDPSTTPLSTLSLHDALPIYRRAAGRVRAPVAARARDRGHAGVTGEGSDRPLGVKGMAGRRRSRPDRRGGPDRPTPGRSEEHTSELQSCENLVCRLLLEKKKE